MTDWEVNVKWRSARPEYQKDKICLHCRNKGSVSCCMWLILARGAGSQMGRAQTIQHEGSRARPFYLSQQKPQRPCCPKAPAQRLVMCLACFSGALTLNDAALNLCNNIICRIWSLEKQYDMLIRSTHCKNILGSSDLTFRIYFSKKK